jgi:hypothetical protein
MVCIFSSISINLTFFQFVFYLLLLLDTASNQNDLLSLVLNIFFFFCMQICMCMLFFRLFIFSFISILRIKGAKQNRQNLISYGGSRQIKLDSYTIYILFLFNRRYQMMMFFGRNAQFIWQIVMKINS